VSAEAPLATRPAYRLWAATYDVENPLTTMDSLAAHEAGLTFDATGSFGVGAEVRPFYERAQKLDRYAADEGLPLLLALRFSK
jgi:hypothetical protein